MPIKIGSPFALIVLQYKQKRGSASCLQTLFPNIIYFFSATGFFKIPSKTAATTAPITTASK